MLRWNNRIDAHQISGVIWMLIGCVSIFSILVYINQSARLDAPNKVSQQTTFDVKPPVKPKPVVKQPKPKPKKREHRPPPVPLANLQNTLSGIEVDLPAFNLAGLDNIDKSLLGDTSGDIAMTSEMVDTPPRVRQRSNLDYPPRARNKEIEGYVVLSLLINEQGLVSSVKVIESSPQGIFEEAAKQSVQRWLFDPARYNGKRVQSWANQTIHFKQG